MKNESIEMSEYRKFNRRRILHNLLRSLVEGKDNTREFLSMARQYTDLDVPSYEEIVDLHKIDDTEVSDTTPSDTEEDTELEFLRFYFDKVYTCLGPADDDIIASIKEQFTKETGKSVPEGY